jgi:hypothetical protein
MTRLEVRPWPSGLGHDVCEEGVLIAEVQDDPLQQGMRAVTFDEDGQRQRSLELPGKVHPGEAALRCQREGRTICTEEP